MFNAFKKLASRQDAPATSSNGAAGATATAANGATNQSIPATPMSGSLQRKFAKGVQYNSKCNVPIWQISNADFIYFFDLQ